MYRSALFFVPCLVGLAADLITKSLVFSRHFDPSIADSKSPRHGEQSVTWWIEGVFGIQTSTNAGALFGMGSGYSWVFALFSVVAIVAILVWLFCFPALSDRWLTFTFGIISGGILGNLYDRIGLGSGENYPAEISNSVRDWILFRIEGVRFFDPWPNFNIADSLLVGGAIMMVIHACFYSTPGVDSSRESQAE